MFIPIIKSKTQKEYSIVQAINLVKRSLGFSIFKKTKATFTLQPDQALSKVSLFVKRSTLGNYQFLAIMVAGLFFSSCQKEQLTNPTLNSTTSSDSSASVAWTSGSGGLVTMTWTIEGTTREALVHLPSGSSKSPAVIFAFHGRSGTMNGFSKKGFEKSWPEAIVVYPQGLPTELHGSHETGWQRSVGEVNYKTHVKDQDLKFFDAMLNTFEQRYNANSRKVFAHGWSNGGEYVYDILWTARADKLAALAPASAMVNTTNGKKQMPVIHTAGTQDKTIGFERQKSNVQQVRSLDDCSSSGNRWASGDDGLLGTKYVSRDNADVVFLQYDGSHGYPSTVPPLIVKFFREVAGE